MGSVKPAIWLLLVAAAAAAGGPVPSDPETIRAGLLAPGRDESAPLRDAAFSEISLRRPAGDGSDLTTMIRTDRYKYAVSDSAEPLLLFDLAEDPLEQNNLTGSSGQAQLQDDLARRVYRWLLNTQVRQ